MNFGDALAALKEGQRVTRWRWRDFKTYLVLAVQAALDDQTDARDAPLVTIRLFGIDAVVEPCIVLYDGKGTCGAWIPSQEDLLAEDWARWLDVAPS